MKISNILIVIIIIIVIGVIIYIYYDHVNSVKIIDTKPKYTKKNRKPNQNKKVRFNSNIKYLEPSISDIKKEILVCSLKDDDYECQYVKPDIISPSIISSIKSPEYKPVHIMASNEDDPYQDNSWDSYFGVPLVDDKDKKKYGKNLIDEHNKFYDSFDKFNKYRIDDSHNIESDNKIDPFDENNLKYLEGKSIKEIYDEQVAGPKIILKKIKKINLNEIEYEDDNEINNGILKNSNIRCLGNGDKYYKNANFTDEF